MSINLTHVFKTLETINNLKCPPDLAPACPIHASDPHLQYLFFSGSRETKPSFIICILSSVMMYIIC